MTVTIDREDQAATAGPEKERQRLLHDAAVATGEVTCTDRTHEHGQPYTIT